MQVKGPRGYKSAKKKFLAVGEACMTIYMHDYIRTYTRLEPLSSEVSTDGALISACAVPPLWLSTGEVEYYGWHTGKRCMN